MEQISKPHIVSFLRMVDRHKWLRPRIRFASVRSKPELIADIMRAFRLDWVTPHLLHLDPRTRSYRGPRVEYDLLGRRYLLDGKPRDFPRESRCLPQFDIERGRFHLDFADFRLVPPERAQPAT